MADPETITAAAGIVKELWPHICAGVEATGLPSFLWLRQRQKSLQQAVEDLQDLESKIKSKVAAETTRLNDCLPEVDRWLNRAAKFLEEAKKFAEEKNEESEDLSAGEPARCGCLCGCTENLVRRCRLCYPIMRKLQEVKKLIDDGNRFETFGSTPEPDLVQVRSTTQTVGMEGMLKELRDYLDDKERSIIAVWGQGGIGKTTLLSELNNELKSRAGDFHAVIMLTVSTNSIADIQRKISDRLALPWKKATESKPQGIDGVEDMFHQLMYSYDKLDRISLMSNKIRNLDISPDCNDLRTLLLQKNSKLDRLGPKFFVFMPNLRVLDLSHTAITELPECDRLVKLQYLNLAHTRITELPRKLSVLKALRHLDLSDTSALKTTNDNCSKLLELRVLNLFRSEYGINDVDDLNLDVLTKLRFLGITIYREDVLRKLKKKDPLAKSTRRLSLKYCEDMSSIQVSSFKHMVLLEEIYIESCNDLKELIADATERGTSQLQVLTLSVLPYLDHVSVGPAPNHFQSLRDLTIAECHKLDNISWVLRLRSLERLVISHSKGMEHIVQEVPKEAQTMDGVSTSQGNEIDEVVTDKGADSVIQSVEFPKLRCVIVNDLPKLRSICSARNFSCLESIRVEGCGNLKRLPISRTYKIEKLKQICGSDEWWKTIGWEDENMEASMHDYFIPI